MDLVIRIDPDVSKSGVAVKSVSSKKIDLHNYSFWDLFEFLRSQRARIKEVRVEASWLITFSWHKKKGGTSSVNASIGRDIGANHQQGRMIVSMCQYLEIPVVEARPLKKMWKGPEGKITHEELARMILVPGRTNQEQRDAALLVI